MERLYLQPVEYACVVAVKNVKIVNKHVEEKSLMRPRTLTHCLYMIWSPYHKEIYVGMTIRSEVSR